MLTLAHGEGILRLMVGAQLFMVVAVVAAAAAAALAVGWVRRLGRQVPGARPPSGAEQFWTGVAAAVLALAVCVGLAWLVLGR
ncbi:MAG: hypothetical protein K2Q20_02075 [Phycisphaerales bacterium]|nr:hypothetical protein [Phycisphaerales bacterium]